MERSLSRRPRAGAASGEIDTEFRGGGLRIRIARLIAFEPQGQTVEVRGGYTEISRVPTRPR